MAKPLTFEEYQKQFPGSSKEGVYKEYVDAFNADQEKSAMRSGPMVGNNGITGPVDANGNPIDDEGNVIQNTNDANYDSPVAEDLQERYGSRSGGYANDNGSNNSLKDKFAANNSTPDYGNRSGAYVDGDGSESSMRKNFAAKNPKAQTMEQNLNDLKNNQNEVNRVTKDLKAFNDMHRSGEMQGPPAPTTAPSPAFKTTPPSLRPTPPAKSTLAQKTTNQAPQGKSNKAMGSQAPTQAAQEQADQFKRYHGTVFDPNSRLDRQKMQAMQGAGVQMNKSGMGPQKPATKKTLTAADMYDKPNPNAKFAKAGR